MMADGRTDFVRGVNIVALKRNGFDLSVVRSIKNVYQIFFRSDLNTNNAIQKIKDEIELIPEVKEFVDFVESSERGVLSQGVSSGRRS